MHDKPWDTSIAGTQDSQDEHRSILDAVLEGDPALAHERMFAHMTRARDFQLQKLVRGAPE